MLILHTLHTFDTRYPEQCIALAINVGDEDIILNKGMTLYFVVETDLITKTPHTKEMDTVNIVKYENMKNAMREQIQNWNNDRKNCHENTNKLRPIPENSTFMFHKDFYPKPRITLLNAELSRDSATIKSFVARIL